MLTGSICSLPQANTEIVQAAFLRLLAPGKSELPPDDFSALIGLLEGDPGSKLGILLKDNQRVEDAAIDLWQNYSPHLVTNYHANFALYMMGCTARNDVSHVRVLKVLMDSLEAERKRGNRILVNMVLNTVYAVVKMKKDPERKYTPECEKVLRDLLEALTLIWNDRLKVHTRFSDPGEENPNNQPQSQRLADCIEEVVKHIVEWGGAEAVPSAWRKEIKPDMRYTGWRKHGNVIYPE